MHSAGDVFSVVDWKFSGVHKLTMSIEYVKGIDNHLENVRSSGRICK